jgi:IS5 family transposase
MPSGGSIHAINKAIFCVLDLHAPVPDETTHRRFRNALTHTM